MRSEEERNRSFTVEEQLTYMFRARLAYLRQKPDIQKTTYCILISICYTASPEIAVYSVELKATVMETEHTSRTLKELVTESSLQLIEFCSHIHNLFFFQFDVILTHITFQHPVALVHLLPSLMQYKFLF
jgi:hypothetical protein